MQFSKVDLNVDGVFEIVNSVVVVVHSDFKWDVLVNGKQVPETCRLLQEPFQVQVSSQLYSTAGH